MQARGRMPPRPAPGNRASAAQQNASTATPAPSNYTSPTQTAPTSSAVAFAQPLRPGTPTARAVTTPPPPERRYHVVAEGESLSRISMRYYGTANRWQDIYDANRDILRGEIALRPGQRLRIP